MANKINSTEQNVSLQYNHEICQRIQEAFDRQRQPHEISDSVMRSLAGEKFIFELERGDISTFRDQSGRILNREQAFALIQTLMNFYTTVPDLEIRIINLAIEESEDDDE